MAADSGGGIEERALHEFSRAAGEAPLFEELDADAVGLGAYRNDYSGPHVWTKRWREYLLGTIGTGIAMGDIDGDRLPDLFIASKDETSKLYRNLGDLQFEDFNDASGFADSPHPASGCGFFDVDNDGDLDLYLCYVGGRNQLWINDGKGHFHEAAEAWGIDVSSGSTMASFADYDRDGDLDIYLQNNLLHHEDSYDKLRDMLFRNEGQGFVEVSSEAGIEGQGHGHSAVWWDYNEDGWPDIYVANDFEDLDKLYRNNKDGTFTDAISEVSPQAPYYSMGADFGDINNDGHSDFWVADMAATTREKHLRTMGNHWHVHKFAPEDETHQYVKNALLLKLERNAFAEIAYLSGLAKTDWTWAARLVDLNNDGWLDGFASNGMLRSFHDTDVVTRPGHSSYDEMMSTAFINEPILKERNFAFENQGNLIFEECGEAWGLGKLGVSFGVAFGDLDLDGDLDLATNNFADKLSIFVNHERARNRIVLRLHGVESNRYGIGAKVVVRSGELIQTKELSLMRGYMSTDQPILHFGLGDAERIDRLEIHWPSGKRQGFQDLSVNRRYEITESGSVEPFKADSNSRPLFGRSSVRLPEEAARKEAYFSDFKRQPMLPFRESRLGGGAAVGDLDGNGALDLVLGGASGTETTVLMNDGSGSFQSYSSLDLGEDFGSEDWDLELFDVEGDGDLDLLVASGGVELEEGDAFYSDRLYLNDGDGELFKNWEAGFSSAFRSTGAIAAGDFDGDGDRDVFLGSRTAPGRYPLAAPSSLWRNEGGSYRRVEGGEWELGRVSEADWADIDGDGDLDLVVSREWAPLAVLENVDGSLRPPVALGPSGLWSSIEILDLDGDGRLDIVAGNLGLNTEYRATPEHSVRLWYGPGRAGAIDLVETVFEDGEEWPREVRDRMDKAFPREMRRIRSYAQYARTPFHELFPDIRERGFRPAEMSETRSGVYWQNDSGSFVFEPLPVFVQSGRTMDIVAQDIDGDGRRDLLFSLELPSPEPWSGRFEGGQLALLLNRQDRGFESLLPWDSGLVIDGSPRGMAWGELNGDGRPELVVTRSEGLPVVFSLNREVFEEMAISSSAGSD